MDKMIQKLETYGMFLSEQRDVDYNTFWRNYFDGSIPVQSSRHEEEAPWNSVPWVEHTADEVEVGDSIHNFYAIDALTWLEIAELYGPGKLVTHCPLVFMASVQQYGIDAREPTWPQGVHRIMEKVIK